MSVNLCYTQKIRGFQQASIIYSAKEVTIFLKRTKFQCRNCGYEQVSVESISRRRVRGESMGACRRVYLEFTSYHR